MKFVLLQPTSVKLNSVNLRSEKHGPDNLVPAVDLSFTLETSNQILDTFDQELLTALYKQPGQADGGQSELVPVSDHPVLRFPKMAQPVKWDAELSGYTLTIDYGTGGKSNIVLKTCEINGWQIECSEGGTVSIKFRVQCADNLDERSMGKLGLLVQHDTQITLVAPEVKQAAIPDGKVTPIKGKKGEGTTPEAALAKALQQGGEPAAA